MFQIVCADPPWKLKDKLPGPGRGAVKHYPCLTVAELEAFELPPVADDALLFLWKLASMPEEALRVCKAWSFKPKSELVWVKRTLSGKRHFGMGRYTRLEHETCIIATRGRGIDLIANHGIRSVFEAPVARHSEKPDAFYDIVRELTTGKRCELFARRQRNGFAAFGNQVEEAAA